MKSLSLENILKVCDGKGYNLDGNINTEVLSVVIDSRKVVMGSLFLAVKGERSDGHDFIEDVYEKGALTVISEKELPDNKKPYIVVNSSLEALKDIARYYRDNLDIKVIGITGSVGKTSTKEAIAAVVSKKYNTLKTAGNFNNEIGLPLTILEIRDEHQVAVIEMGISDFGEMRRLTDIAKPDLYVITNIGECHLENLINRDGVLKAKSEIFDSIKEGSVIILNGDDDKLSEIDMVKGIKPIFYGINIKNDIYAENIKNDGFDGIVFDAVYQNKKTKIRVNMPGMHMVYNSLVAFLMGLVLNVELSDIIEGIQEIKTISGRNNKVITKNYTVIDDCYNANPVSMRSAIDVLSHADTRKVAILGDMFELGDESPKYHLETGRYCSEKKIDLLISIGEKARDIHNGAMTSDKGIKSVYFKNIKEAESEICSFLKEKDTILVKASNGMHFNVLVDLIKQKGEL